MAESRGSFGRVVVAGLAAASLLAVASAKPWQSVPGENGGPPSTQDSPLALALALVVLAGWGALLVVRRTARRVVCVLAGLAAIGACACVVLFAHSHLTGWFWAAAVAAVASVVLLALAWRGIPGWPEMGTRYDAPGTAPRGPSDDPRELWRRLDEGHDPTTEDLP